MINNILINNKKNPFIALFFHSTKKTIKKIMNLFKRTKNLN
jgi:hypothetical protein